MNSKLDKRRKEILNILARVPISSTQQLAEDTGVSNETMRKDLDALADEGLIVKVHGGVALAALAVGAPAALSLKFLLTCAPHIMRRKSGQSHKAPSG